MRSVGVAACTLGSLVLLASPAASESEAPLEAYVVSYPLRATFI